MSATSPSALLVAVLAAGLVAGGGTWWVMRDDPAAAPVAAPVSAGEGQQVLPAEGEGVPVTEPDLAAAALPAQTEPASTPRGATGTPFWTVIVASKTEQEGGEATARSFAERLSGLGYQPEVFHSSAHTSLRPGYWVAATGRHADARPASDVAVHLKDLGFEVAYPRCVGEAAQCG